MEQLNRSDIKEIITEAIAPLLTEMKASNDAHEKDILRLTKQSTEHYEEIKDLRDNMQKQVQRCQVLTGESQEKTGERIGDLENIVTRIDEHVEQNKKDISDIKDSVKDYKDDKKFNISNIYIIIGFVIMIVLAVIPMLRG